MSLNFNASVLLGGQIKGKGSPGLKFTRIFPELTILLLFVFCYLQRINIDFWNDEIYSLLNFTFTSLSQTVTSYPVPNNHVFSNLLNNIFLKFQGIDSFSELIENPFKLRILFFFYALLTLALTYKIGIKFFNRSVGRLAAIVLITTIPYFNFALQDRGYGLSILLLVSIVYSCLSYEKKPKFIYLIWIVAATSAVIYTIPSNLLPVGALLFSYGIYFLAALTGKFKTPKTYRKQRALIPFRIGLVLAIGLALGILYYTPILRNVFFNEYITDIRPFSFSLLKFEFLQITHGMISGRWIILVLALPGFYKIFHSQRNSLRALLLFLLICFLPLLIIYIQGSWPPPRTFVYFAPFSSLLLAVGLNGFYRLFIPNLKYKELIFFSGVLIYSVGVMYFQLQKMDTTLVNDIRNGTRSQNLYEQYYADRYTPLKEVRRLKYRLLKDKLPVLISGCEPHGIPHYLDAYKIPFHQSGDLNMLLATHDSIFIITNHPFPFLGLAEYNGELLNDTLNYHNILLFTKSKVSYSIRNEMNRFSAEYKDSIQFVMDVFADGEYKSYDNADALCFISDSTKYRFGDLMEFVSRSPYISYIKTTDDAATTASAIIRANRHELKVLPITGISEFYLGRKTKNDSTATTGLLYFNDFNTTLRTDTPDSTEIPARIKAETNYQILDSTKLFSSSFGADIRDLDNASILKISFEAKFEKNTGALIVFSIVRDTKSVVWQGKSLRPYFTGNNQWQKVISTFGLPGNILPSDQLKIYVWNPEKETILLDNLRVDKFD